MKSIILFRHGQACWSEDINRDHDKPLSEIGIEESKKMGLYLLKNDLIPDLVISSSAIRTKTTAELAIKYGQWNCPLIIEKDIYGGRPIFLCDLIHKLDDQHNLICLVGHEPNFSTFISKTTNTPFKPFYTASMAKINFNIKKWHEIDFGIGRLDWSVNPRENI